MKKGKKIIKRDNVPPKRSLSKKHSSSKRKDQKKAFSTLIVGHTYSNLKNVESLLLKNGMIPASPLKKEQISAKELSEVLVPNINSSSEYKQKKISHVWDGLALDLFLSNKKNRWWGWADPDAVVLLEYWKNIDPSMFFVLAYNSPERYLKKYLEASGKISQKKIKKVLNDYVMYNKALLEFYYRNQERVFLLNTQEVKINDRESTRFIQKQMGLYLPTKKSKNVQIETESISNEAEDEVSSFLIRNIISEYPKPNDLYTELESVSNLPLQNVFYRPFNIYDALKKFQKANKESRTFKKELEKHYLDKKTLQERVDKEQKELTTLKQELHNKEKSSQELQQTKEQLQKEKEKVSDELSKENELLLSQLHSVQEELEKHYLDKKTLQERVDKEQKELTTLKQDLQKKEVSSQELQQTKEQLQKEKEKVSNELSKENELLLSQLHSVQEELEKYYLENKKLKEKEAEGKRHYGAAERVKSQLSYRLGAKIIEKSTSPVGLIFLPFSLFVVRSEWKKEKQQKNKKLPPIDTYTDAYEAERIKKHLSYVLGQTTIETMKNPFGIFILPFRLIGRRKEWKKGRES